MKDFQWICKWKIPVTAVIIPASTCNNISVLSIGSMLKFIKINMVIPIIPTIKELVIRTMIQSSL
ncbi:hypothetical protein [Methanobacterium sp. SMA-27]|uniref:hypothetical protein n=1 Tax=Methanobacterium sp. SMA-27 TaxID=1495336 RepID=UPI000A778ECC|nr:hypothetical protein [Methanobacterium sp. SMA-27]